MNHWIQSLHCQRFSEYVNIHLLTVLSPWSKQSKLGWISHQSSKKLSFSHNDDVCWETFYIVLKRILFTVENYPRILNRYALAVHSSWNVMQSFFKIQKHFTLIRGRLESGSTARNPSARILTARHKKCQLLDRQKYAVRVPHFVFEQLIKKVQLLEYLSTWQNFCDSKKLIFNFFHIGKIKTYPNLT